MNEIDRLAAEALDKHERLLHHKCLELLLGSMVARQGVRETRRHLMWYVRHLKEFE